MSHQGFCSSRDGGHCNCCMRPSRQKLRDERAELQTEIYTLQDKNAELQKELANLKTRIKAMNRGGDK